MMDRRHFLAGTLALGLMPKRAFSTADLARNGSEAKGMTLAQAASKAGLLYGSPLFPGELHNDAYLKLFGTQTSILTNTVYMFVT
jgi:hypothetical protein